MNRTYQKAVMCFAPALLLTMACAEKTKSKDAAAAPTRSSGQPMKAASQPSTSQAQRTQPLAIGTGLVKSDFKMKSTLGGELSFNDLKGEKGKLIIFTCNHCPWAKAWEARVVEIGNKYQKLGFGVVAVNPNDPEAYPEDDFVTMEERAKSTGMAFPYVVDATSEVARAFGATKTPEVFLFGADGKLVYHGAVDDNAQSPDEVKEHYLTQALDQVAAGKPVSMPQTKALGCSIKFRS